MLLLICFVAVFVGTVVWCWCTAPNARPLPPRRREKDLWG